MNHHSSRLKTRYELDEFITTNKHIIETLVYAALLTLIASRALLDLVTECAEDDAVFPPERWAATVRSHAPLTLHELMRTAVPVSRSDRLPSGGRCGTD